MAMKTPWIFFSSLPLWIEIITLEIVDDAFTSCATGYISRQFIYIVNENNDVGRRKTSQSYSVYVINRSRKVMHICPMYIYSTCTRMVSLNHISIASEWVLLSVFTICFVLHGPIRLRDRLHSLAAMPYSADHGCRLQTSFPSNNYAFTNQSSVHCVAGSNIWGSPTVRNEVFPIWFVTGSSLPRR